MHRIRICGQIHHSYEQVIELSDEKLMEFRCRLSIAKTKGDQAIDNCLGEDYGNTEPLDGECREWSAELLDDKGSIIEYLD